MGGEKKTKKYFYHMFEGYTFALSPAFQAFTFVNDEGISKFGASLKSKKFTFLPERELRYLELKATELFLSIDLQALFY